MAAFFALPVAATEPLDLVDALLWQQRSVECLALTEPTHRQATAALEGALRPSSQPTVRLCSLVADSRLGRGQ